MKKDKDVKKIKRGYLFVGIAIIIILVISYFIKINIDTGENFNVDDSLLGIMIFHNPFVLGLYLVISIKLILVGLRKIKLLWER